MFGYQYRRMIRGLSFALRQRSLWAAVMLGTALLLDPGIAHAKFQRMMLPPQSAAIPAGTAYAAKAFCLDSNLKTPKASDMFGSIAAPLSSVRVKAGEKSYSFGEALAQGIIEAVGSGSYDSVSIVNKTSGEIQFHVEKESVLLGDSSMDDADLPKIVEEIQKRGVLSQEEMWEISDRIQADEVVHRWGLGTVFLDLDSGMPQLQYSGLNFSVSPVRMRHVNDMVRSGLQENNPTGFVVQRLDGYKPGSEEPAHTMFVLYTGSDKPVFVTGLENLDKIEAAAQQAWVDVGGNPPPRLALWADSDVARDAIGMNLAFSALKAGTSTSGDVVDMLNQRYRWDVPTDWSDTLQAKSVDVSWPKGTVAVTRTGDNYVAKAKFGDAAFTVLSKSSTLVSEVMALIRRFFEELSILPADWRADPGVQEAALQELKELIQEQVNTYRASVQQEDGKPVIVEGTFQDQVFKQQFAELADPGGAALQVASAGN